ncbi:peptide deformylase [Methylomonas sp. AM2-LC]|uniref:peptide deformylase n=1 Tax=Methylomonas sp. AM2-LC TaxID=3153301 RepID=UPI0032658DA8
MIKNLKILQLGDPGLRVPASPVNDFSCEVFRELLSNLQTMMLEENGVGIAAPQLGVALQVIIIASRPTKRYPSAPNMDAVVMINPRLTIADSELNKDWEGCLSVPGIRALVPRYKSVKVEYQDVQGKSIEMLLSDFPARVFQHEFDHLNGLVYLDRVENNRDIFSEGEFFKLINSQEQLAV